MSTSRILSPQPAPRSDTAPTDTRYGSGIETLVASAAELLMADDGSGCKQMRF